MRLALDILSILLIGPLVGVEFAVSAFVSPVLAEVGGTAEARATRIFARRLGAFMPFWYALCLILLITEGIVQRHEPGLPWVAGSAMLWAAVIVITVFLLVPINNRIAAMNPDDFSAGLRAQHVRWERLHRGRIAVLALATVLFLIGVRL
jgi:uncharacterized membrane protein